MEIRIRLLFKKGTITLSREGEKERSGPHLKKGAHQTQEEELSLQVDFGSGVVCRRGESERERTTPRNRTGEKRGQPYNRKKRPPRGRGHFLPPPVGKKKKAIPDPEEGGSKGIP